MYSTSCNYYTSDLQISIITISLDIAIINCLMGGQIKTPDSPDSDEEKTPLMLKVNSTILVEHKTHNIIREDILLR